MDRQMNKWAGQKEKVNGWMNRKMNGGNEL